MLKCLYLFRANLDKFNQAWSYHIEVPLFFNNNKHILYNSRHAWRLSANSCRWNFDEKCLAPYQVLLYQYIGLRSCSQRYNPVNPQYKRVLNSHKDFMCILKDLCVFQMFSRVYNGTRCWINSARWNKRWLCKLNSNFLLRIFNRNTHLKLHEFTVAITIVFSLCTGNLNALIL